VQNSTNHFLILRMSKEINLSIAFHRGEERLFASYEYDTELNNSIRKVSGAKWSQTKNNGTFL
jgi:hypothetical protein